ncbi:MAG: BMP family ABC transporter substrate-binding protein [Chloroflexota bacterium]
MRLFSLLIGLVLLSACAPSPAVIAPPTVGAITAGAATSAALNIAMILPGPIQDADYNAVGAQALDQVKQQTGAQTTFSESVAVADAERVAREYLNSGHNVVVFHGGQFLTIVQKLAAAFPDATFIMESSGQIPGLPSNVWNIGRKFYQGFYALGILAAATSSSKKIGYVAGVKLPDFVASLNAVKQAAADTDPAVQVQYAFVGDQNDPIKARETTASQIDAGVDVVVVSVNLGVQGVAEAAKAATKPVFFTTYYTDKPELAPKLLSVSLLSDFSTPYVHIVKSIQSGTRGGYVEMRPGNGFALSDIRNAPPEAAQKAQTAFTAVATGQKDVQEITDRIVGE